MQWSNAASSNGLNNGNNAATSLRQDSSSRQRPSHFLSTSIIAITYHIKTREAVTTAAARLCNLLNAAFNYSARNAAVLINAMVYYSMLQSTSQHCSAEINYQLLNAGIINPKLQSTTRCCNLLLNAAIINSMLQCTTRRCNLPRDAATLQSNTRRFNQ